MTLYNFIVVYIGIIGIQNSKKNIPIFILLRKTKFTYLIQNW